jgi:integrase
LRTPVTHDQADHQFQWLRTEANVLRFDVARYQPRLHDFRHTFAVTRLTSWYREGKDVQRLLPQLSTYLGHVSIDETATYLRMTTDLLREASQRFELYACPKSEEVRHG